MRFGKLVSALAILLFLSVPAYSGGTYLRLALYSGAEHPHAKASSYMAKILERKSNGEIQMEIRTSDDMNSPESMLEQLSFGGIAAALADADILMDYYPQLRSLISSYDDVYRNYDEIADYLYSNGLIVLACYENRTRALFSLSQAGLRYKGSTIGVVGGHYYQRKASELGSRSRAISLNDSAALLSDYSIEAVEAPIVDFSFTDAYQFTKSVYILNDRELPSLMLMNKHVFNKMGKDEQDIVREAAKLSSYYANALVRRFEETLLTSLNREKKVING